jgi:hypothetical protein
MTEILPPRTRSVSRVAAARAQSSAERRVTSAIRAIINHFPTDDELEQMVRHALTAFRRGLVWERGSIVNLVI